MKALTICQPYAHLIVRREKRVENREWTTEYRGPLAIHAGKSRLWLDEGDVSFFETKGDPMALGAVIGEAELVDVLHIDRIDAGEFDAKYPWLRTHPHTNGTWCMVFGDVRRYPVPIPCRGFLGLWEWAQ